MRISDHRILITGGGTGIGLAFARALAGRGNRILIAGRRSQPLEDAARDLEGVTTATVDLVREDSIRELLSVVRERLGGLSFLVNNAGIQYNDDYATTDADEICQHVDREVGTNLTGLVKLTTLAMPLLLLAPEAAIVNVSSILAISPKKSAPVYCATKAAVRSFTQALRYQLAEQAPHIRVVEVAPPIVDTAMTPGRGRRKLRPEQVAAEALRGIEADRVEIAVGATKAVRWIYRLSPTVVERPLRNR